MNPVTLNKPSTHKTVRLTEYDQKWQQIAGDLFNRVKAHVLDRAVVERGSYSIRRTDTRVAAKIVIFESRLSSGNLGSWYPRLDGVYVCLRTKDDPKLAHLTVSFLPHHPPQHESFSFFRLDPNADLAQMADFIAVEVENRCFI